MPAVEVVFYKDSEGRIPVLDWLKEVQKREPRAFAKCLSRVKRLRQVGHEIRRPDADYLRNAIYELRSSFGTVNYRILYFFHGRTACVLAHGLTKEDKIPDRDIETALFRKARFEQDPEAHAHYEEQDGGKN